jgi:hypothetical protein
MRAVNVLKASYAPAIGTDAVTRARGDSDALPLCEGCDTTISAMFWPEAGRPSHREAQDRGSDPER